MYTYSGTPSANGSLAIVTKDEYEDVTATDSCRAIDIEWISVHPSLIFEHDDMSYNIDCFEKIGHIDI